MADNIDTLRQRLRDALDTLEQLVSLDRLARRVMARDLAEMHDDLASMLVEIDQLLIEISAQRLAVERQQPDTDLRE
jgi:hypothetical protein